MISFDVYSIIFSQHAIVKVNFSFCVPIEQVASNNNLPQSINIKDSRITIKNFGALIVFLLTSFFEISFEFYKPGIILIVNTDKNVAVATYFIVLRTLSKKKKLVHFELCDVTCQLILYSFFGCCLELYTS